MIWSLYNKYRGVVFGLLSGLFWALNLFLIDKVTYTYKSLSDNYLFFSAIVLLFIEFFSFLLLFFLKGKNIFLDISSNIRVIKSNICLLFFSAMGMGLYILSIIFSGAVITAYFTSIYPIFSLLFIFILYRKISYRVFVSIILSSIGLFLTTEYTDIDAFEIYGIIFALLCACSWGSESVCCEYLSIKYIKSETILFFRYIFSIFLSILFVLTFLFLGYTISLNQEFLFYLFLVSFFSLSSYLLYYNAISLIGASYAINLNVGYILWIMLFSFSTYHFTHFSIIGGIFIFISIIFSFFRGSK
ncbi:hypothetical protein QV09_12095 [Gallibacterium salpingitidis]|uniref:EamA domain-containing protein n=1 Tax=Gallibacterium salpingitidis TaxID=505341 RepID=A0AB36DZD2_9PAST|nr:DMT family transporter [Gallibacterium salpingitidis]OBX06523.1 hypothetical protein QV09_12095 [Gallibacterium salpingitidis]WKS99126.1 DMT family transporter [Gallibacterium salpingitidis]